MFKKVVIVLIDIVGYKCVVIIPFKLVILLSYNRLVRPNKISLRNTDESCLGVAFSLGTLRSMKNT